MGRLLLLCALLLIGILVPAPHQARAQVPPEAAASVSVDREGETIGDPITISVTVTYPASLDVVIPQAALDLGALEPAVPEIVGRTSDGSSDQVTFILRTHAFFVGLIEVRVPPLAIVDESGGTIGEVIPPASSLEVVSVLPDDLASVTPRPLKPAERIGGGPVPLGLVVGPVVAVLVLLGLAMVFRRRRGRVAMVIEEPLPDPALAAAAELSVISASGLLPDRLEEFARRVDGAVRRFLELRYDIPALNLTSIELADRLATAGAVAGTVRQVATLCVETDAIAYAGAVPASDRAARYVDLAHSIVQPEAPAETPFESPSAAPAGPRWARPAPLNDREEGGDDAFRRP